MITLKNILSVLCSVSHLYVTQYVRFNEVKQTEKTMSSFTMLVWNFQGPYLFSCKILYLGFSCEQDMAQILAAIAEERVNHISLLGYVLRHN